MRPATRRGRAGVLPRESFDAPDDLRKQALSQLALGQLQDEVPGMPNEASPGLEQPLLEATPKSNRTSLARKR